MASWHDDPSLWCSDDDGLREFNPNSWMNPGGRVVGFCTSGVSWVEPQMRSSAGGGHLVGTVTNHSIAGDDIPESQGTARSSIACSTKENNSSNFGSHYRCFHHLERASA